MSGASLHETHICRDCGAEITMPYATPDTPTGELERLRDEVRDLEGQLRLARRAEDSLMRVILALQGHREPTP